LALAFLVLARCEAAASARPDDIARSRPPEPGKSLTNKECRQLAAAIEKAVSAQDVAKLDALFDWDAMLEKATAGIPAPAAARRAFLRSVHKPGGPASLSSMYTP
jgi:hypothetical protein